MRHIRTVCRAIDNANPTLYLRYIVGWTLILCAPAYAQEEWEPTFIDTQNVLLDISCSDSSYCLIAGTVNWMGGLLVLRSWDGGRTFEVASRNTSYVGLHFYDIHAVGRMHAYMKSDSGFIYSSRDGGSSWQRHGPFQNNGVMSEIFMVDSIIGYVIVRGTPDSLFSTIDGWETWQSSPMVDPWPDENSSVQAFFADHSGVVSAVFNNGRSYLLGYSDNESGGWDYVNVPSDSLPLWSAVYRSEDEVWCWFRKRLIPDRTWFSSRILRTTDRGDSWQTVLDTTLSDSVMIEQIAFQGASILLATIAGPVRSTDNGVTWIEEPVSGIPQFSSAHIEFPEGTDGIFFTSGLNDPTVFLPKSQSGVTTNTRAAPFPDCLGDLNVIQTTPRKADGISVAFVPTLTGMYRIATYSVQGECLSTEKFSGVADHAIRRSLASGLTTHGPFLIVVSGPCGTRAEIVN